MEFTTGQKICGIIHYENMLMDDVKMYQKELDKDKRWMSLLEKLPNIGFIWEFKMKQMHRLKRESESREFMLKGILYAQDMTRRELEQICNM